jgi:hypothetical protein
MPLRLKLLVNARRAVIGIDQRMVEQGLLDLGRHPIGCVRLCGASESISPPAP